MATITLDTQNDIVRDKLLLFAKAATAISAIDLLENSEELVLAELSEALLADFQSEFEVIDSPGDDEDPLGEPQGYIILNEDNDLWSITVYDTEAEAEESIQSNINRWDSFKREDVAIVPILKAF